jgi:TPR repeat protein
MKTSVLIGNLVLSLLLITSCSESNDPKVLFDSGEYKKAYALWKPMAENGDLYAQNYLGIQYYLGLGVDRNFQAANKWFEKSASGGFADAQYNLGAMYENGEFVEKSFIDAYKWFYAAKENGNTHAEKRMQALGEEHKLFGNQMNHAAELAKEFIN